MALLKFRPQGGFACVLALMQQEGMPAGNAALQQQIGRVIQRLYASGGMLCAYPNSPLANALNQQANAPQPVPTRPATLGFLPGVPQQQQPNPGLLAQQPAEVSVQAPRFDAAQEIRSAPSTDAPPTMSAEPVPQPSVQY